MARLKAWAYLWPFTLAEGSRRATRSRAKLAEEVLRAVLRVVPRELRIVDLERPELVPLHAGREVAVKATQPDLVLVANGHVRSMIYGPERFRRPQRSTRIALRASPCCKGATVTLACGAAFGGLAVALWGTRPLRCRRSCGTPRPEAAPMPGFRGVVGKVRLITPIFESLFSRKRACKTIRRTSPHHGRFLPDNSIRWPR